MTNRPQPLEQVPLDRVTQALYAKIYATMEPVRLAVAESRLITDEWTGVLGKFHESLPSLDVKAYVDFRLELGTLTELFGRAVRVPLSEATRALCVQILFHDLPRVAAIATKLNEEESPKFFAAISNEDPELAFRNFQTADVRAKSHVKKCDLEQALVTIVNDRIHEAQRLVLEDLQKWLALQGIDGPVLTVSAGEQPRFVFRPSGDVWKVVFDGNPEFHVGNTVGARYLDWLLHHPNEPIGALDLEKAVIPEKATARSPEAFDSGLDGKAIRGYLREVGTLRAERDVAKESGDTAEVERLEKDIEIIEGQLKRTGRSKDSGEKARGNVRKAIAAVKRKLAKGDKYQKAFLKHIGSMVKTGYKCEYVQPQGKIWQ